jgi:hypothetical protein
MKKIWLFIKQYWPGMIAGYVLKTAIAWLIWKYHSPKIIALASMIWPF